MIGLVNSLSHDTVALLMIATRFERECLMKCSIKGSKAVTNYYCEANDKRALANYYYLKKTYNFLSVIINK